MGMYTEIFFRADLRQDTPEEVVNVLQYMVDGGARPALPNHPFFETHRWDRMARGTSAYFPDVFESKMGPNYHDSWSLGITGNLKNYDSEIEKFFDWIDPYVDEQEGLFIGYSLSETSEVPTLYFKKEES